jgi:thymidylate kinase
MDKKKRGLFIVIEGYDKEGKSQIDLLRNYFIIDRQEEVEVMNFPSNKEIYYTDRSIDQPRSRTK